ncbi:MAG: septal ring factor EnvC (AmiA/AmiB activator), partial [Candidatus Binatia bacterium]
MSRTALLLAALLIVALDVALGVGAAAAVDSRSAAAVRVTDRLEQRVRDLSVEVAEAARLFSDRSSLLRSVRDQAERATAELQRLRDRLEALETRSSDAEQLRGERLRAVYRAGRLGNPRTLRDPVAANRAIKLARFIPALADGDDGRDEAAEVEYGAVLLAIEQAELQRSGIDRQARDLEFELVSEERALDRRSAVLAGARSELAMLAGDDASVVAGQGHEGIDLLELAGLREQRKMLAAAQGPPVQAEFGRSEPESVGDVTADSSFAFPDLNVGDGPSGSYAAVDEGDEVDDFPSSQGSFESVLDVGGEPDPVQSQEEQAEREREEQRKAELAKVAKAERQKLEEKEAQRKAAAELAQKEAAAVALANAAVGQLGDPAADPAADPVPAETGFPSLKGRLRVPMLGRVIARFGQSHPSGAIYNGLIIRGAVGSDVRAAAEGDVIFSGDFPGLGATLILAHGDRYHTVYARMETVRFP